MPGDGTADAGKVMDTVRELVPDATAFDMQTIAEEAGTVISASCFGAIAGAGVLPFDVEAFRETVRASSRGVDKSLAAFDRAYAIASGAETAPQPAAPAPLDTSKSLRGPDRLLQAFEATQQRLEALPLSVRPVANLGLDKLVTFQDVDYAAGYLDRLESIAKADADAGGAEHQFAFTATAAKYLANALAYDDIIRVADAKTRQGRFESIQTEVGAGPDHLTRVTEYTHPGGEEVISIMPARLGRFVQARPRLARGIDRLVNRGRHIRTDRLSGFIMLYLAAGLRPWRRALLRHADEMEHITQWLDTAQNRLTDNYDFGVETLKCRRLIKGYSDTHARGLSRFDRVIEASAMLAGREDAGDWTRRLIAAALADHKNTELDGAIETIRSFAGSGPGTS